MVAGAPEMRVLVKNTFLEFVEADSDEEGAQPSIWSSQTDSKALGIWNCRDCVDLAASRPDQPADDVEPELPADPARAHAIPENAKPSGGSLPDLNVSLQVRVKNTFLELVEEGDEEDGPQSRVPKSGTDPCTALRFCDAAVLSSDLPSEVPCETVVDCGIAGAEVAAPAPGESMAAEVRRGRSGREQARQEVENQKDEERQQRERQREETGAGRAAKTQSIRVREDAGQILYSRGRSAVTDGFTDASAPVDEGLTTLMLKNVPNDYTREMLLELLDTFGFFGRYDFVYYPVDFARHAGLGYAFVNMLTSADAKQVCWTLEGFRQWSVPSSKICSIGWCLPCQGLQSNVDRYRNSPVMHKSVPDEFKPVVFSGGRRVPFPKPTRKLRRPSTRNGGC